MPDGLGADDRRLYLDIHGGEFIYGAGESCRAMAIGAAKRVGARVWSVDYRMPPDHPYPAGLDDCLTVYRALLEDHRPEELVVGGASAGGNLAAALLLRARDEGLPLPAGAVLMTPGSDLTASSDSLQTNLGLDPLITTSASPAGSGSPSSRARSISAAAMFPPADCPPTMIRSGAWTSSSAR